MKPASQLIAYMGEQFTWSLIARRILMLTVLRDGAYDSAKGKKREILLFTGLQQMGINTCFWSIDIQSQVKISWVYATLSKLGKNILYS